VKKRYLVLTTCCLTFLFLNCVIANAENRVNENDNDNTSKTDPKTAEQQESVEESVEAKAGEPAETKLPDHTDVNSSVCAHPSVKYLEQLNRSEIEKDKYQGLIDNIDVAECRRLFTEKKQKPAEDIYQPIEHFTKSPKLRPCCAFGHSLRTTISGSSVPVKLDNVLNPERLGHHSYMKRSVETEMNGLIYTCKGGTVDIAHVRDYADWTAYLYERIIKVLGTGVLMEIPAEAANREILLRPVLTELTEDERRNLAILLAQRISFQLSVWHEIVTWYDHRSVALFSERLSSFSPEDMYSNLLGAIIGGEAIKTGVDFNMAMDCKIESAVHNLVPLPPGQTKKTLDSVDGLWWDRTKTIPDMQMVTRRNLDVGDEIRPWIISDKYSPYCSGREEKPTSLVVPKYGPKDLLLDDLYELRFTVDRTNVPKFHIPDVDRHYVNQHDYAGIIKKIRREVKDEFGPYGDTNGMDLKELGVVQKYSHEFDQEKPCGRGDLDCSLTRNEELNGVRIGKIFLGGANFPGLFLGMTVAEGKTMGGLFRVGKFTSAINFTNGNYILHAKGAESPVLLFCSVEAEDGSGRVEIDYPFVNPFETKCLPGSSWGIKLDLLEVLYESGNDGFALRPLEFGVVWNALGNGHTVDFLKRHLLLSIGLAPEYVSVGNDKDGALTAYFSSIFERMFWDNRIEMRIFGNFRDNLTNYQHFYAEAGSSLQYNHLWSRRDFRGGEPLHSIVSIGIEVGVQYWYKQKPSMPGMLKKIQVVWDDDFIPASWNVSGHALLYVETTIPKLGIF